MKYCNNCGIQITDDALFCEECGTKQQNVESENTSPPSSTQNNKNTSNKKTIGGCLIAVLAIILLIVSVSFLIKSCDFSADTSPETIEEVAAEFTKAFAIKFNAKTAVELMSEDLIDYYLNNYGFSTEDEIISRLKQTMAIRKDDTIAYYGKDWKAEIKEVEILKEDEEFAIVIVSVSHTGSDALWNTNIDDWRIYLKKENNVWRVYEFES